MPQKVPELAGELQRLLDSFNSGGARTPGPDPGRAKAPTRGLSNGEGTRGDRAGAQTAVPGEPVPGTPPADAGRDAGSAPERRAGDLQREQDDLARAARIKAIADVTRPTARLLGAPAGRHAELVKAELALFRDRKREIATLIDALHGDLLHDEAIGRAIALCMEANDLGECHRLLQKVRSAPARDRIAALHPSVGAALARAADAPGERPVPPV